ncbi:MAG: protease inhibitor I42 family protein [Burkholderiales bacterium]
MTMTQRLHGGLALAAALLAACSTPDAPKAPAPQVMIADAGRRAITVTGEVAGANITLERAQPLIVRLAINVTTGQEWSVVDLKPGVLATQGPKFERAPRNVGSSEGEGAVVWQFAPQSAGTVTLNFELRRPRSLQPATQVVSYQVVVK